MEKLPKKATIISWEGDGEVFRVRYTQDDGQKVVAIVKLIGWAKPPADFMKRVMKAIKAGPKTTVRRQGPRPS